MNQELIKVYPTVEESPITADEFRELLETLTKSNTAPPRRIAAAAIFKAQRSRTSGKLYLLADDCNLSEVI